MWRVCLGWVPFAVFGHFTTASLIGVQICSDLEVLGGSSGGLGGWGWGGVMHAAHLNSTKQYRCGIMDNFWTGIVLVCCFNLKGLNQSIPIYLSGPVLSYPIYIHDVCVILSYLHTWCVCMVCVVVVCPFREAQAQKHATCARLEFETWLVLDWAQCVERSGPKVSTRIDGWCIQHEKDHLPSGYLT